MEIFELDPLFRDVQLARVFADDKVFVDGTPLRPLEEIAAAYQVLGPAVASDRVRLRRFVEAHFILPPDEDVTVAPPPGGDIREHIRLLWRALRREPDAPAPGSTLLPLPQPYVVPGGRFREIYYWDSYFTMLGLQASGAGSGRGGDQELVSHMLGNFVHLLGRHGFIPNGNRSYYLSRSQPPVLALMVELATADQPALALTHYRDALAHEYDYWMDRTAPTHHVVELPDGSRLNRYWDRLDAPRPESFSRDEELAGRANRPRGELFRDLRSAAESGWDFSSRWLADGQHLETIRTTQLVPVDLNCFLWRLEVMLARAHAVSGDAAEQSHFERAAEARRRALEKYCWSSGADFFCDYDLAAGAPSPQLTLAGVTPLFFGLVSTAQAAAVARRVRELFLAPGGVVTTLRETGQQWDAPNGWAPLQWLSVHGLSRAGDTGLAAEIARRWSRLNLDTFARTGRLLEKYNVRDTVRAPGGGEYPSQHGFGWTNGVLLEFLRDYPLE
jgi:alpha,alpha-trehalase